MVPVEIQQRQGVARNRGTPTLKAMVPESAA
jgi:hypothetical protein